MTKVVLTGGPCGGKTEFLVYLQKQLKDKNFNFSCVPETASALLSLGYLDECSINFFDFQNLLFKIQLLNEYQMEKTTDLLLCDRGLFDALAYMKEEDFNHMLKLNKVDRNALYDTYDFALYLRTIAYEREGEFKINRPYDTVSSAIIRDKSLFNVWKDILVQPDVVYTESCEDKLKILYKLFLDSISKCTTKGLKLSDIITDDNLSYIKDGIDLILDNNNVPHNVRQKTRGLIL